jgi:hypothetical protein
MDVGCRGGLYMGGEGFGDESPFGAESVWNK